MQRFMVIVLLAAAFNSATTVQAEIIRQENLFKKGVWSVVLREWSDGEKQCVAEHVEGKHVELDIVVGNGTDSIGIYIGHDASQLQKDNFSFRIDNFPPWKKDNPIFDAGWLIYELESETDNVFFEIERQFKKGHHFYHLDESGYAINSFSLKGSNAALTELVTCIEKYLK